MLSRRAFSKSSICGCWSPPLQVLKFNVDGGSQVTNGKLGSMGIRGVLCNAKGEVLVWFLE